MDSEAKVNVDACTDILKNVCKNRRHYVKKKYFDEVEASKVSIKSPVPYITDVEWQNLTTLWSTPRHKVCLLLSLVHATRVLFFIVGKDACCVCVSVQFCSSYLVDLLSMHFWLACR
jgi:hypothetical protein